MGRRGNKNIFKNKIYLKIAILGILGPGPKIGLSRGSTATPTCPAKKG
jgi:hypothetical protein